jgi:hypothetical protein
MVWIRCTTCGDRCQVKRQHGVGLSELRCLVCGGRVVRCPAGLAVLRQGMRGKQKNDVLFPAASSRRCYLEHCIASVPIGSRECGDGHQQPPY